MISSDNIDHIAGFLRETNIHIAFQRENASGRVWSYYNYSELSLLSHSEMNVLLASIEDKKVALLQVDDKVAKISKTLQNQINLGELGLEGHTVVWIDDEELDTIIATFLSIISKRRQELDSNKLKLSKATPLVQKVELIVDQIKDESVSFIKKCANRVAKFARKIAEKISEDAATQKDLDKKKAKRDQDKKDRILRNQVKKEVLKKEQLKEDTTKN